MNAVYSKVNEIIFKLFIFNVFFIYYETKFIAGTLHSWCMLFGLFLTLPIVIKKYVDINIKLPLDYFFILILFLIISLGFLVNYSTVDWLNFQAYVLMLATYVYVKENATIETLHFLSSVIKYFLLINGLLMIGQLLGGDFFPARFLAAGDPPLIIASGVSDGPTKNGMLISFALSYMFAGLIFRNIPFSVFDASIFFIGLISIIIATSRAGILSFLFVVVFGCIFALFQYLKKNKIYILKISSIFYISSIVFLLIFISIRYSLNFETLYNLRSPTSNPYGLDVMLYKLNNYGDGSTEERFSSILFFAQMLFESPINFLSVGFGTGTFEALYGLNIHNSYLELIFTTGFMGFFVFLFLIRSILRKSMSGPNVIIIIPVVFSLLSIMIFMSTHDVIRGRIFWFALGFLSSFAYSKSMLTKLVPLK